MRHEYYYRGFIIQIEDSLRSFIARVFKDVTESPLIRLRAESGASSTKLLLAQARSRVDTLLKKEQSFAGRSSTERAPSRSAKQAKDKALACEARDGRERPSRGPGVILHNGAPRSRK